MRPCSILGAAVALALRSKTRITLLICVLVAGFAALDYYQRKRAEHSHRAWTQHYRLRRSQRWQYRGVSLASNLTLVTAYLDVGNFTKGVHAEHRSNETYRTWMRAFDSIENPVVAYFDDAQTARYFRELRGSKPTKVVMISKSRLWSFRLQSAIQAVIDRPDYVKRYPNTVWAGYDCAMHAKYDLVVKAIDRNYFRTKYVAWIDVGIFRDLAHDRSRRPFLMEIPRVHVEDSVIFNEVTSMNASLSIDEVIKDGHFWVAGGFFAGRVDILLEFAAEYKQNVVKYLAQNLTNADQSILYAMYHPSNRVRPKTKLQVLEPEGSRFSEWFFVCYTLREQWFSKTLWEPQHYCIYTDGSDGNGTTASELT